VPENRGIAGVILAAGESSRMGFAKALLPYRETTFVEYLAGLLADHGLDPLFLVLGHDAGRIRAAVRLPDPVRVLVNENYRQGQLSSLQVAIRAIQAEAVALRGLLLAPVDHPCLSAEALQQLLAVFAAEQPDVAIPTAAGRRGHPVVFAARLLPELLAAPLDQGARSVVRRHEVREVPVGDEGVLADIDDPEIYRRVTGEVVPRGGREGKPGEP
jgi:molybdenum cofactor cytidylyltransferase